MGRGITGFNFAVRPLCCLVLVCGLSLPVQSQAEQRHALLIGNADYPVGPLKNPLNDATDMHRMLTEQLLFDQVTLVTNASKREMARAIKELVKGLGADDLAVVYFAGHGLRGENGENYLVPVDAEIEGPDDVEVEGYALGSVLAKLRTRGSGNNLVILDSCRNNPWADSFSGDQRSWANANRGLARDRVSASTVIVYATQPKQTAADNCGRNGCFTKALLQHLPVAGREFLSSMRAVKKAVRRETRTQVPTIEGLPDEPIVLLPAKLAPIPVDIKKATTGRLTIKAEPPTARVRITNIAQRYEPGIELPLNKNYQVYVTANGYKPYRAMHPLGEADQVVWVELERNTQTTAQTTAAQAETTSPAVNPPPAIKTGRLWIKAEPANARVRIMNIGPKYSDGITLELDKRYDVLVSKSGYRAWREQVLLSSAKQVVAAVLEKKPVVRRLPYEPEMVGIPGGSFRMGDLSGEGDDDEKPVHRVNVPAFRLAKTEVTVSQFSAFVTDSGYSTEAERNVSDQGCYAWNDDEWAWRKGYSWQSPGFEQSNEHPVVCVSWNDAQAFIAWLNKQAGKTFRLPSEAEWEYTARGGQESKYYYGNNSSGLCRYGNVADETKSPAGNSWSTKAACDDGHWFAAPVGSYQGTWKGLKDMHGNVWEWLEDKWHSDYQGAPADGSAWVSGGEPHRVLRGGSWSNYPQIVRSAIRLRLAASDRYDFSGFRLAEDMLR